MMEGKGKIKRAFYLMFMAAFVVTFFVCITGCSETEDVAGIVDASDGAEVEYSDDQETQETIDDGVAESAESNVVEDNAADNIAAEEYGTGEEEAKYTFTSMSEVMYVTHNLNIRDLPDMTGNIIGELKKGEPVYVIGKCNETGWFSLQSGYVCNDFISMDRPEEEVVETESAQEPDTIDSDIERSAGSNTNRSSGESVHIDVPEESNTNGEDLVWVPVNGGKKYHRSKGCSSMEDPVQIPKEEAIARGYTPCGRCY